MTINVQLARKQNLSVEDIVQLEQLHNLRDSIHRLIEVAIIHNNRGLAYTLGQSLFPLEEEMQSLWKFDRNIAYYKFWNVKGCLCGKVDNNDAYPTGYYYTSSLCWLHHKVPDDVVNKE